jgi:hypothetical protein
MSAQPSEAASSAAAASSSAAAAATTTTTTTTISEQEELRARIQKLELENNVLKKQTERATQDSESFRNQAVSQLQSLQKNVADKNKLIKSLKNGLKVAAAAAAASTPAAGLTEMDLRKRLQESEDATELYRTQQEESVHRQHQWSQELDRMRELYRVLDEKNKNEKILYEKKLQMKEKERLNVVESLTSERVLVETERRQRHAMISKAESDHVARRQKLTRKLKKTSKELNDGMEEKKIRERKIGAMKKEMLA